MDYVAILPIFFVTVMLGGIVPAALFTRPEKPYPEWLGLWHFLLLLALVGIGTIWLLDINFPHRHQIQEATISTVDNVDIAVFGSTTVNVNERFGKDFQPGDKIYKLNEEKGILFYKFEPFYVDEDNIHKYKEKE